MVYEVEIRFLDRFDRWWAYFSEEEDALSYSREFCEEHANVGIFITEVTHCAEEVPKVKRKVTVGDFSRSREQQP